MKTKKQILRITRTAMLLGLTVAAQYFIQILLGATIVSQLITGSLVNMFLILSALICGFWSGFSIAVIVPFISLAIGRMPHIWLIPFIMLGNLAIVFAFWAICGRKVYDMSIRFFSLNWAGASIAGALLKFMVLYFGVTKIFINFILVNDSALKAPQIAKMTSVITFNYSFPQLATALLGSILVYMTYPVLKKAVINNQTNQTNQSETKKKANVKN